MRALGDDPLPVYNDPLPDHSQLNFWHVLCTGGGNTKSQAQGSEEEGEGMEEGGASGEEGEDKTAKKGGGAGEEDSNRDRKRRKGLH